MVVYFLCTPFFYCIVLSSMYQNGDHSEAQKMILQVVVKSSFHHAARGRNSAGARNDALCKRPAVIKN